METGPKEARIGLTKKLLFALLLAFLLIPLIVVVDYANSRYRAHLVRQLWGDIQTIQPDRSTYADALRVVDRHKEYWKADGVCNPADCVWRFKVLNDQVRWLSPLLIHSEVLSRFLAGTSEKTTLSSLGIHDWMAGGAIHVRDGKVWFSSAYVHTYSPAGYGRLSVAVDCVRDPPGDVTPYMNNVTGTYDHQLEDGEKFKINWYAGLKGVRYTLGAGAPEEIRREAFDLDLRCLDALRGCEHYAELAPSAWSRRGEKLRGWNGLFDTPTRGRIPNKTLLAVGVLALVCGAIIVYAGKVWSGASRHISFILIALGLVMVAIGATSVYIVEVAEEAALWAWPVSALLWVVLIEYGPRSPKTTRWRIALFGALVLFLASLLATLGRKHDVPGVLLVVVLFSSWVAVAMCQPVSRMARALRCVSFAAIAICAASFYLVARSWDTILDGSRYSVMTLTFGWDIRLPRPFDYYIVGQGFKVLLLVSIPLTSLCSVTYLWKWWTETRKSVAAGWVTTVTLRQPPD